MCEYPSHLVAQPNRAKAVDKVTQPEVLKGRARTRDRLRSYGNPAKESAMNEASSWRTSSQKPLCKISSNKINHQVDL
jgi:hypothetical protein